MSDDTWTCVDDALPDDELTVLVWYRDTPTSREIGLGYYLGDEGWHTDGNRPITVSHWRDLPEPPPMPVGTVTTCSACGAVTNWVHPQQTFIGHFVGCRYGAEKGAHA